MEKHHYCHWLAQKYSEQNKCQFIKLDITEFLSLGYRRSAWEVNQFCKTYN